jgi:hypothetical protein
MQQQKLNLKSESKIKQKDPISLLYTITLFLRKNYSTSKI